MKIDLIDAMQRAAATLKQYDSSEVRLYHHNDTDGLTSGSILLTSFQQAGYEVSRFSLEKPYPQVLQEIFSSYHKIIVFVDFAGKIAPLISQMNDGRNLVIILDHHPAEAVEDPTVFNLDGDLYGLKGDRDISASATSYLFADILMNLYGTDAHRMSHLGTLGAIGDGFLVDGALVGINRDVLQEAVDIGLIRIDQKALGEEYLITLGGVEYPALEICKSLDTLGGAGYYDGGTSLGIELCLHGVNEEMNEKIVLLKKEMEKIFSKELENLRKNIRTTENIQWFNVEDRFSPMGVKMIGVFCMFVKDMDFLDETKYLAGFQNVPDEVPGFGKIQFDSSKISMRVSQFLMDKIRTGDTPGLDRFLPVATNKIGGFVDACHGLSAATTVSRGEDELLISEMEKELAMRMIGNKDFEAEGIKMS